MGGIPGIYHPGSMGGDTLYIPPGYMRGVHPVLGETERFKPVLYLRVVYIPGFTSLLGIPPYVTVSHFLASYEGIRRVYPGCTVSLLLVVNYPFHCWLSSFCSFSACFTPFCPFVSR